MIEKKIIKKDQEHTMLLDDEDGWLLDILRAFLHKGYACTTIRGNQLNNLNEKIDYTIEPKYVKGTNKVQINKLFHRLLMEIHHPELRDNPNLQVDHINGNRLDNRKENLRLVTPQQNNMNRKPLKNSTSKYKGVFWDKNRNKWLVLIMIGDKSRYLGRYQDEREAALAYDKAAKKLFGEYAYLNFPKETT